jgi:hypothetical protein
MLLRLVVQKLNNKQEQNIQTNKQKLNNYGHHHIQCLLSHEKILELGIIRKGNIIIVELQTVRKN